MEFITSLSTHSNLDSRWRTTQNLDRVLCG